MTLDWLPEELHSVAYRLARADQAAFDIGNLTLEWSKSEPLELVEREISDSKVDIVVVNVRPMPPIIPLLFSEAINHLRASLDNTVWHLVEKHVGQLSFHQALNVEFPICHSENNFGQWRRKRKKNNLEILSGPSDLSDRLEKLQPFNDVTQSIPSMSDRFGVLIGEEPDLRHPLALLQGYSNDDKHRQLRLGAVKSNILTSYTSLWEQDRGLRSLDSGSVLGSFPKGPSIELEAGTTILVERPGAPGTWVVPVREIEALRRYVADIAIPTLLKGIALTGVIPPDLDPSDSGFDFKPRVLQAQGRSAVDRLETATHKAFIDAMRAPRKRIRTDSTDENASG